MGTVVVNKKLMLNFCPNDYRKVAYVMWSEVGAERYGQKGGNHFRAQCVLGEL